MKLQRKLTDAEWEEIVKEGPGVRMYKDKKTLFYNGEILYDEDIHEYLVHDREERWSWEVVIILPGVEVIPRCTFILCWKVETVVMADTVKRIEYGSFKGCSRLEFVKLSRNLEYIGEWAFEDCKSLTSIFIPPSCTMIDRNAMEECKSLIIFHVPRHTQLGDCVIAGTKLLNSSHFGEDELQIDYFGNYQTNEQVNAWIKNINGGDEECALHRACSSFNPMTDIISQIVKKQGFKSFHKKNAIGISPFKYLEENPFADIDQQKLMKRYILEMMGETI